MLQKAVTPLPAMETWTAAVGLSQKGRAWSSSDETRFRPLVSEAQPIKRYQLWDGGCWEQNLPQC